MTAHYSEHEAEAEEKSGDPLSNLRQHVARTGAKQRIGRAAAESDTCASFLLWQLQQHQKHQKDAIQDQEERQKSNN
jgi:hypothetical protein